MSNDREDLRRRRREQDACGLPPPVPKGCEIVHSRDRRPDPCDENELPDLCEIDRDSFHPPEPPPAPTAIPYSPPDRILLTNRERTAECEVEFHTHAGSSATVPVGTFFRFTEALIRFQLQVATIQDRDASGVAEGTIVYVQDTDEYWRFLDPGWEDMSAYKHPQVVQQYKDRVDALQDELDERAEESAELALDCFYVNETQVEECDPDGESVPALGTDPALGTVFSAQVLAGSYRSYTSQKVADAQASTVARGLLVCRWGNREETYTCEPNENADPVPAGTGSIVLVDGDPVASTTPAPGPAANGFTSVGTVTAGVNIVLSPIGRADAEARAEAQVRNLLSCVYLNETQTSLCDPDEESNNAEIHISTPETYDSMQYHDALSGGTGNPTIVRENMISGRTIDDANSVALSLANAARECYWLNQASQQDVACPPDKTLTIFDAGHTYPVGAVLRTPVVGEDYDAVILITGSENQYDIIGDTQADHTSVEGDEVQAGDVRSYISVVDADEQAAIIARSRITCLYCNKPLQAKCEAPSGSLDQTSAVPGGLYCDTSLAAAQELANLQSSIPNRLKSTGVECTFANKEVWASCGSHINDPNEGPILVTPTLEDSPGADEFSVRATPGAGTYVKVPAGSFVIPESEGEGSPQDTVNALAKELALLFTDCFFDSEEVTVHCGAYFDGTTFVQGDDGQSSDYSSRSNNGNGVSVVVPAAREQSYVSVADAKRKARLVGLSLLNCFYENAEIIAYCDFSGNEVDMPSPLTPATLGSHSGSAEYAPSSSGSQVTPVIIQAGSYRSESKQILKGAVLAVVNSLLDCFYESAAVSLKCGDYDLDASLIQTQLNKAPDADIITAGEGLLDGTNQVSENSRGHTDAPVEAEARTFRSSTSQEEANLQAVTLVYSMLDCFYENDEFISTVECGSTLTFDGDTPILTPYDGTDPYSGNSNGGDGTSLSLPVGTVRSYTDMNDLKVRTWSLLLSMLDCFWENDEFISTVECGDALDFDTEGNPFIIAYDPEEDPPYSGNSNGGGGTSLSLPAGTMRSHTGMNDLKLRTWSLLLSMLDCFWENEEKTPGDCPTGTQQVENPGETPKVSAGTVRSYAGQENADEKAQLVANGLRTCINPTHFSGTPGDTGPSGNCENPCISFYS